MVERPQMVIQRNPFWLLGATMRDNTRRIIELADEKALILDDEECRKARSDLTTPKQRLAAEVAWLPGVSPAKAGELVRILQERPLYFSETTGLPTLVRANLEAAAFQWDGPGDIAQVPPADAATRIRQFAHLVDAIEPTEVLRDLNEDRAVSGFPEIHGTEQVEAEIAELRRRYREVVRSTLDRMLPKTLIAAMSEAVRADTAAGERHAAAFLDELVDLYQEETRGLLDGEIEKIESLLKHARTAAHRGPEGVSPILSEIEEAARTWVTLAEPIQMSLRARGIRHDHSHRIAFAIRSLGVDLFNERGMLEQSQRITALLQELFAYVPDVAVRIDEDASAIKSIAEQQRKAVEQAKEWADQITYRTEIGLLLKQPLQISPAGIKWKRQHFPLESITRVRWGGTRHSVNGIPTGSNFTIAVGDNRSEAVIELRNSKKYQAFVERLWPAVCIRLMGNILTTLRDGRELMFGDAVLTDLGMKLTKRKLFRAGEQAFCDWWHLQIFSQDGSFYIQSKDDRRIRAVMSYLTTPNVHLLEHLIRMKFKTQDQKMSALLN